MFDLKRFRKERKISQTELADQLGVGQSFISQIERGKDPMPDTLIAKLADIYQIDNIENEDYSDLDNNIESKEGNSNSLTTYIIQQISEKDKKIEELSKYVGKLETLLEQNGIDYKGIFENIKRGAV